MTSLTPLHATFDVSSGESSLSCSSRGVPQLPKTESVLSQLGSLSECHALIVVRKNRLQAII